MSKKNVMPAISDEEFNSMVGMDYSHTGTGNDTESIVQTDDAEKRTIPEPVVESAPDVASVLSYVNEVGDVSTASVVSAASVPIDPEIPSIPSESTASSALESSNTVTAPVVSELPSAITAPTPPDPIRRPSTKQRKASFDEYRETFLRAPKISDRQPVFLSRTTRDHLDEIVRKLGDRKMSVSGFLENLARHHLEAYAEDIEVWKRL